ncbi:MAG TPA: hypothetical protein VN893_22780 [Bryobacteraceae bacterium]|nr:hypothetical protein [Bryobacteraceae bacterium]
MAGTMIKAAMVAFAVVSAFGADPEQVRFSAGDESVEHAIHLPDEVVAILKNDGAVRQVLESEHLSAGHLPMSWFAASEVHLAGPKEKDIVVVGMGKLKRAGLTTFWVFRPRYPGYEVLLSATEHDLTVTDERWKAYRIIKTSAVTATSIRSAAYRFEGGQYKMFKDSSVKRAE